MIANSNAQIISQGLAPDVRVIEKREEPGTLIKVAAYCRVSTNMEVQQQSLETQMAAFQKTISEHPGWILAGIYADKGISGTSVKHREEFLRMVEDAKAGKIQYVLVKSISRFSRNTVDALRYVRELKNYGVSVFFDKEKLDTGNATSEFILSIYAASAQEEIISLSNNMKVGRRMRYAAGSTPWTRLYGFRRGKDEEWLIDEYEAGIVRRIFREYVEGRSLPEICHDLEAEGVPSTGGKTTWHPTSVSCMLHNERYAGDLRMQKSYISDPLSHKRTDNREAKLKQYYKEDHHQAIVDKETYQIAMTISAMKDMHRGMGQYPYYGYLKCPICGENMVRFGLPRNNHTFAWTCGGKASQKGALRKQRTACPPYYIIETYIDAAFCEAFQKMAIQASDGDRGKHRESTELVSLAEKLARGEKRVEYKLLYDMVKQITFPQWGIMKVEWKNGIITHARITYKKMADEPYPEIHLELVERKRKYCKPVIKETYIVNGVPVLTGCPDRQAEGIEHAHTAVLGLTILEPKVYEPPIPRVYGPKTTSISGDAEKAMVNRSKLKKWRTEE